MKTAKISNFSPELMYKAVCEDVRQHCLREAKGHDAFARRPRATLDVLAWHAAKAEALRRLAEDLRILKDGTPRQR